MAIDYIIDYDCVPKQTLSTQGIINRLKGRERARTIIQLYRDHGDDRPPSEMGFEMSRRTADGQEETETIVVQELIDAAASLDTVEHHCLGCPANVAGQPFGCMGFIQYPISAQAEKWLLDQLPVPDEPLVWLLLKRGVKDFDYDGEDIKTLRAASDTYFEDRFASSRQLGEFQITANQVFDMIFSVGDINPNHGAILLLFFNAIDRDLEAPEIMHIAPAGPDVTEKHPFLIQPVEKDDQTTQEVKDFFYAVYTAWRLNVSLRVDA